MLPLDFGMLPFNSAIQIPQALSCAFHNHIIVGILNVIREERTKVEQMFAAQCVLVFLKPVVIQCISQDYGALIELPCRKQQ